MNLALLLLSVLLVARVVRTQTEDWSAVLENLKGDVEMIKNFSDINKMYPYNRMVMVADFFGPREAGSDGHEAIIDYLVHDLKISSLKVVTEDVKVSNWKEINSIASFFSKFRNKTLSIVAYAPSVSGDIEAEMLLVKSFEELESKASEAKGKIVVYNQDCTDYQECTKYRLQGASMAAKHGAKAALTRSVSSSLYRAHTGRVEYGNENKIPAAAITIEDAAFVERMLKRDQNSRIRLSIKTEIGEEKTSRNIIADLTGSVSPNQILISGTHTDSWHVGDGVTNAGVGMNILYETMKLFHEIGLKPKKTLRLALWTAGVQNDKGEREYLERQQSKREEQVKLVMKSDRGAFDIRGLIINNGGKMEGLIKAIFEKFFNDWNLVLDTKTIVNNETSTWVVEQNIPRMDFLTNMEKYYSVYNSGGDSIDKISPEGQNRAMTLWASIYYILGSVEFE